MSVCFSPADKSQDEIQETETRKHPQKGVIILKGVISWPVTVTSLGNFKLQLNYVSLKVF